MEEIKMEVKNMNGITLDYDQAANLMDDDIRETLHTMMAPCSEQEFFSAYEKAHQKKYGKEWELSKENPTW